MRLSDSDVSGLRDLAVDLGDCYASIGDLNAALLQVIPPFFNADIAAVNTADFTQSSVHAIARNRRPGHFDTDPAMSRLIREHPVLDHYRRTNDRSPQIVSHFITQTKWRSTGLYCEVFRPLGTPHQMLVPMTTEFTHAGVGLSLNRTRDFSQHDGDLAQALQFAILALHRVASATLPPVSSIEAVIDRHRLTPREGEVLQCLVTGASVHAIAHSLRISAGTVRKHLEHIYAKTETHDRLLLARMCATPESLASAKA